MPETPPRKRATRHLVRLLVAIVLLGYPVLIYLLHGYLDPAQLLAGLLGLLGLRALVSAWVLKRRIGWQVTLAVALWIAAAGVLLAFGDVRMHWLRFYPMLFDLAVAAAFLGSLAARQSLVERFARAMRHDLPPEGVIYTRRVTWAWGLLMVAIALVSLYTAVSASLQQWSLFNGLVVYAVIALAFAVEYAVRRYMRRRWRRHERLA
ncbi:MAG TPA: hypothetical protein VFJ15_08610 [Oleiagrimonas sp.]|nr:hypothetical protein [Oleiagrimonas sp.]